MRSLIIVVLISTILLFACSGKDKISVDKDPPYPPELIPHLGDLGDPNTNFDDENNGIDAYPDDDWIRISWNHFLDSDLDYVRIFRFDEFNPEPVMVDSISSNNDYYLDSKNRLSTYIRYSYFIEVVDNAGNTALSDTVSYKLLSKVNLTEPGVGNYVAPDSVKFKWTASGFASQYRLLVFDENHDFLWQKNMPVATEGDFFEAIWANDQTPQYTGQIFWRVDAFNYDNELDMNIGSESNEWIAHLSPILKKR